MHRNDDNPQQRNGSKFRWSDEVSILTVFDQFTFSTLPCDPEVARDAILEQGKKWQKNYVVDKDCNRDARIIYCSPDGPNHLPAVNIGILLSRFADSQRGINRTLFLSSVADGYLSMITSISKIIKGMHFIIKVSRLDLVYPANLIHVIEDGQFVRTVYAIRDSSGWVFFENGNILTFEDQDLYRARRKRDRLTPEILSTYLKRTGQGSLRKEFWISENTPARVLATRHFRLWREKS